MKKLLIAAAACAGIATSAHAGITIDGTLDAAYGAATSHVGFNSGAPSGNFGAPTAFSNNVAYDIYLHDEGGTLYGFLQGLGATHGLDFANLYFDLDPAAGNGSDLGFEIGNDDAFIPGVAGSATGLAGISYALGTNSFEFSISNDYFTSAIGGLNYYPGHTLASAGSTVVLRLSQGLGYSVAGGADYGPNRLGAFTINNSAAPEPATWAMMIVGFLGAGSALRLRRRQAAAA